MTWKKGQSGNPGGRPKEFGDVRELARKYTDRALEVLAEIMNDPSAKESARTMAAQVLLDRGHGKPSQPMEHSGAGGEPIELVWKVVDPKEET